MASDSDQPTSTRSGSNLSGSSKKEELSHSSFFKQQTLEGASNSPQMDGEGATLTPNGHQSQSMQKGTQSFGQSSYAHPQEPDFDASMDFSKESKEDFLSEPHWDLVENGEPSSGQASLHPSSSYEFNGESQGERLEDELQKEGAQAQASFDEGMTHQEIRNSTLLEKTSALFSEVVEQTKSKLTALRNRTEKKLFSFSWKNGQFITLEQIKELDPEQILVWVQQLNQRKDFIWIKKYVPLVVCTYFFAGDLAIFINEWIPEPSLRLMSNANRSLMLKQMSDYQPIVIRNLFNDQGLIPGENNGSLEGVAVRSSLPFNLIGVMVFADAKRSLATLEDKSASLVYPVGVDDEIPGKLKITKIEAHKVTFFNEGNNKLEYLELPEDSIIQASVGAVGGGPVGGIERSSPNQFNISRLEVDKTLADLNNILTQALVRPNFENGAPAGFKIFQIVPGSIYEKLGLQNGDVISGLNGEPINDPGKAFEMLNQLKTSSHMELQVKRDNKPFTNSYDIH